MMATRRLALVGLLMAVWLLAAAEAPAQGFGVGVGFGRGGGSGVYIGAGRPDPWLYGPGYYGYRPYYYPPTELTYRSYYPPVRQQIYATAQPAEAPVQISVRVPADAEVWFDGAKTAQNGAVRRFISPPLPPGRHYTYEITARWKKDGQLATEKRTIRFESGKQGEVSVEFQ